jgi:hypothetical protein
MINLNWRFTKDYIALGNKKFLYTTSNSNYLKKHLEAEDIIQGMQCGELNMEIIKQSVNNIEWEIIQSALSCFFDWDITKQDLWDSDFDYYISEYLPYDFFEYVYKYLKDISDDYDYVKDRMIDGNFFKFNRLVLDVCKYNANRHEIIEQLGYTDKLLWEEDMFDIANKEYEDNLYYYAINQDRLLRALQNIYTYLSENLLYLDSIINIKAEEKKNIVQMLSCVDNLQKLSSYSYYKKKPKKLKTKKSYIIKDKNTGLYKIGKSNNPKNREKTLQAEKPTYELIKIFNKNWEAHLHKKYKEQRLRGEWFKLNKLQVEYICRHYE